MEAAAAMSSGDGGWKTSWGLESRPSDACGSSPSALSCRPDSAFLCSPCDTRSHSRHARVRLCEVCERSPAAVTCKADAADLCAACDADIHSANPLARRHERVPVVPFLDSSSGDDDGGIYGGNHHRYHFKEAVAVEDCFFGRFGEDVDVDDLKGADCFFSDALDPYLDLVENADSVVPVQQETKFCRDGGVAAVTGAMPVQERPAVDFDFGRRHGSAASYSTYSVCSSEVGVVPDAVGDASKGCTNGAPGNAQASATATATTVDREARVMRYREKRKNRRFEKTIRYASRKAYAETRPRIKGRFVKRAEVEVAVMPVTDGGYGVVPSF